jgi:hypothetical protein
MCSAYVYHLNKRLEKEREQLQAQREEEKRAAAQRARERLTPLEERLARVLTSIPIEVQREGLPLSTLQTSLRGRWRGNCHPGELGTALRKLGFRRERHYHGSTVWYAPEKLNKQMSQIQN